MIPKYINDWLIIIEQMNNDNTYKLAWGRAIIECIVLNEYDLDNNVECGIIHFDRIAYNMCKYYWNQLFFFNLKQAPYKDKEPVICKYTYELINKYKKITASSIPVWFNEAEEVFAKNDKLFFDYNIHKISNVLHENVSWRFKNINSRTLDIYDIEKQKSQVKISIENILLLKDYSVIISKLLNYKWAQLLEKFNYAPKITSKVNGISETKIKRNSLTKFKEELLKEFEGGPIIDFYTGEPLDVDNISVDHVIPWSYMYSDDIWNLVLTSKSYNSKKSNSIPTQETIDCLKKRNERIVESLSEKYKISMEEAIKNNYVDKFYNESRI